MRRIALLGVSLLLSGCGYAGSPVSGFGGFVGDTHTYHLNPNAPPGQAENEKRVLGQEVAVAPLLPEPGEVWPGPPAPIPTLADVQKLNAVPLPPPSAVTTPGAVFPQNAPKTP